MADFDEVAPGSEPAAVAMAPSDAYPTTYSVQSEGGSVNQSATRATRKLAQRVWDRVANRWVYYADDAPNPTPGSTTPASSPGNLEASTHQVLYEVPTVTDAFALLSDLNALADDLAAGFVTHANLETLVSARLSQALGSALEGQDIGTLAQAVASKADAAAVTQALNAKADASAVAGKADVSALAGYLKRVPRTYVNPNTPGEYLTQGDQLLFVAVGNTITLSQTDPIGTVVTVKRYESGTTGGGFVTVQFLPAGMPAMQFTHHLYGDDTAHTYVKHTSQWQLVHVSSPSRNPQNVREVSTADQVADAGDVVIVDVSDLTSGQSRRVILAQRFAEQGECVIKVDGTPAGDGRMVAIDAGAYAGTEDRTVAPGNGPDARFYYLGALYPHQAVRLKLIGRRFHIVG